MKAWSVKDAIEDQVVLATEVHAGDKKMFAGVFELPRVSGTEFVKPLAEVAFLGLLVSFGRRNGEVL